jgi:lipoprotein NlpI
MTPIARLARVAERAVAVLMSGAILAERRPAGHAPILRATMRSLLDLLRPGARAKRAEEDAATWTSRAESLRSEGKLREAAAAYEQALAAGPATAPLLLQLGATYTHLEDFASAERCFTQLVALDPQNADGWCMLGVVTKDQKRFGEAIGHFGRALALNPSFSEAHFNLGLSLFELGRLDEASLSFTRCTELRRGQPWTGDRARALEQEHSPVFEPMDMGVNEIKLKHDCEQLAYLLEGGQLPAPYAGVLEDYRALLAEMRGQVDENSLAPFDAAKHPLVARTYKRPLHLADVPPPASSIIDPTLDFESIQDRYLAAAPNIVAIDGLLTPEALAAIRRFCRESTIWNNIKPGYLGAYFFDGFCSELLLRLAWELRERMPRVIKDLPLNMMWGFKCDSTLPGLAVHADAAAVNVNFWITEDEANLDPAGGGLRVYEHVAPEDWDFNMYNHDPGKIQEYLKSVGSEPTRYPYRANRAVMFDSDLFHATDQPRFREGYLNRRINITLLYGTRLA